MVTVRSLYGESCSAPEPTSDACPQACQQCSYVTVSRRQPEHGGLKMSPTLLVIAFTHYCVSLDITSRMPLSGSVGSGLGRRPLDKATPLRSPTPRPEPESLFRMRFAQQN